MDRKIFRLSLSIFLMTVLFACANDDEKSADQGVIKILYLTSLKFRGNLGGIVGADHKCNNDPQKPPGNYKAFLVDGTTRRACSTPFCSGANESVDWVLKANTTYRNKEGTIVGKTDTNKPIFTQALQNPVKNCVILPLEECRFWSGLKDDWTTDTARLCPQGGQAWHNGSGGADGTNGNAALGTALYQQGIGPFISESHHGCGAVDFPLLCAEQ
ncbi:MAG: DUF1554 domain-containing protein [Leptospiraceae bacterium]|nr:DUF1554 domain-containing protein [Leptospiraceae bacterium]